MERRGHPSRLPAGSLRSVLTGPGRAAGKSADTRKGQGAVGSGGAQAHTPEMDLHGRNEYLRDLREEYCLASRKEKTRLLDEAERRTALCRKVLIRKLRHPAQLAPRAPRPPRQRRYDTAVRSALAELWQMFDYPCGQRFAPLLREQVPRLRKRREWNCPEEVAAKLVTISPKSIDRLLAGERARLRLPRYRQTPQRRLLLAQIPIKVASDWNRAQVGNMQFDYVAHCGQSTAGSYLWTVSMVDIATGWWEGEVIAERTQTATRSALNRIRQRLPFRLRELHPDNDSAILNKLLIEYCRNNKIALSRSRPLKKNDNCWVEQKNRTHVRQVLGYHRLSGELQRRLVASLYWAWTQWRNFFQPVMRLKEKTRLAGKLHRRYDHTATPYRRLLNSRQLSTSAREALQRQYDQLSPIKLMRIIQEKQRQLFRILRQNDTDARRRTQPRPVTSFMTQQPNVRLPRKMT
jgi:hypothetical protein